ncbi:MAG: EAL domain-containing protein [Hydrogenothermaceae bacterium]|nr:EAL domain-containing protein [Hydrogenothermaceae bacterium]
MSILDKEENFSLFFLKRMKPLNYWFEILENHTYIDMLKNGRINMFLQPIVDSHRLTIIGYEILVRGYEENGKLIYPNYIFKTTEKTKTINYLDRVCREISIKTAPEFGLSDYMIFINFIPTSIHDPETCLKTTME